ncbi:MAG: carbohydrate ABC transporter permease [Lachnospiraceae bacterium]|nr:carbohydrate ABC transporter permease [Lachnospiraceae bacterium]
MKEKAHDNYNPEGYVRPEDSAYSKSQNRVAATLFILLSLLVFLPILLVFIVSVSSQDSVTAAGYSFFPRELSLDAYRYIFRSGGYMARAFFNSVFITICGTSLGLFLMCPLAYAISREEFHFRKPLLIFLMIPMIFSGGLVASYMVNTQILHLKNDYFALILPGLCSTWYIMILRNYFKSSVPEALIESAKLDGGRHIQIFRLIVLPIAKPVVMTVAVFQMFAYWNSWYPSLLYLDSNHTELYPLQYVLVNMEKSIEAITKNAQYLSGMTGYTPPSVTIRMAMVVVVILPVMILFPFFRRFLKTGMTVGAVKE